MARYALSIDIYMQFTGARLYCICPTFNNLHELPSFHGYYV